MSDYPDPTQAAQALEDLTTAGVACTRLDADGLRRLMPVFRLTTEHGVLTTRGGVLLADRITASLNRWLDAHGVVMHAQANVAAINMVEATITLDGGETLHPDALVIAVGAAVARLIPDLAPRVGARRQIVAYLKPPRARREAWQRAPVFVGLGADDAHWGAPPVAGTDLKLAAGSMSREIGGCESQFCAVTDAETEALLGRYRPVIPDIDDYEVLRMKACVYATSPSGLFVESVDDNRRIWVIGGGDGGDYKRAPATALSLVARLTSACARS